MELNLREKNAAEKVKLIAAYRGYNLTKLGQEFNQRYGTKYTQDTFARKLRNNSITFAEMEQFGNILGFDVDLTLKD